MGAKFSTGYNYEYSIVVKKFRGRCPANSTLHSTGAKSRVNASVLADSRARSGAQRRVGGVHTRKPTKGGGATYVALGGF